MRVLRPFLILRHSLLFLAAFVVAAILLAGTGVHVHPLRLLAAGAIPLLAWAASVLEATRGVEVWWQQLLATGNTVVAALVGVIPLWLFGVVPDDPDALVAILAALTTATLLYLVLRSAAHGLGQKLGR